MFKQHLPLTDISMYIFFIFVQIPYRNHDLLQDYEFFYLWFQFGSERQYDPGRIGKTVDVSSRQNNYVPVCCAVHWGACGEECAQLEAVDGGGRGGGTRK
jgi:hypothetical protein